MDFARAQGEGCMGTIDICVLNYVFDMGRPRNLIVKDALSTLAHNLETQVLVCTIVRAGDAVVLSISLREHGDSVLFCSILQLTLERTDLFLGELLCRSPDQLGYSSDVLVRGPGGSVALARTDESVKRQDVPRVRFGRRFYLESNWCRSRKNG